ncbi:MAG: hypothetical protein IVW51_16090 [Thermaceae bacterium]|nr:hypothetical protein [Thermaceae bacterium]
MPYEFLNDQQLAQYGTFTADPTPQQLVDCFRLNVGDLLIPAAGERRTPFDQLRTLPTRVSVPARVAALGRVEAIHAVGVSEVLLQEVPDSRLGSSSKYAEVAWAGQLVKLSRKRCYATLLAYVNHLEKSAAGGDLRPLRDPNAVGVLDSIWQD